MNTDLIIFTDDNTVIYYDDHKFVEASVDEFISQLKESKKVIIYDSDIDEYYLDNKKIVFNELQKKELEKPYSDFYDKIYYLIKVYDEEKRYLELKERGKFNNQEEAYFYVNYIYSILSNDKKIEKSEQKVKSSIKQFLISLLGIIVSVIFGYSTYFLTELTLDFLTNMDFLYAIILLYSTASYLLFICLFVGTVLISESNFFEIIKAKNELKQEKEKPTERKEVLEARESYRKYKENQLSKTNETKIDFISILLDSAQRIEEESMFLNSEDRFAITKKSNDILKEYNERMKKLETEILTLDSEFLIQIDLSKRMKDLFQELEQMKKNHSEAQVEELRLLLANQEEQELGTPRVLR